MKLSDSLYICEPLCSARQAENNWLTRRRTYREQNGIAREVYTGERKNAQETERENAENSTGDS